MAYQPYRDFINESLLKEDHIRVEQQLMGLLNKFTSSLQGKSKDELLDIKIIVLLSMQRNYKQGLLVNIYKGMLESIEEHIAKIKE